MDASGYVDGANLSRQETRALVRDIESARTPAEQFAREQDRLTEALNKGAISQATYNRLLKDKSDKLGIGAASFTPYIAALTAATVAVTAAVGGGVAFVSHLRNVQNEIDSTVDSAGKLGVSFNELTSLRFAAQEGGGVDAATVDASIKKMQVSMAKAVDGDKETRAAFKRLGVDAGELMKSGPVSATMQIADALQSVNSQGEKLKLTMAIFGKSGTELVSTLDQGSAALQESIDFQQKWNSLTDAQVTAVGMNNDAWDRIAVVIDGISTQLAAEFAPAMLLVADELLGIASSATDVKSSIQTIVEDTVYFVGTLKDAVELLAVVQSTVNAIAGGDMQAAGDRIADAFTIDQGMEFVNSYYQKRQEIEAQSAKKAEDRERKRQQMLAEEGVSAQEQLDNKAYFAMVDRINAEEDKRIQMENRVAQTAIKNANDYFAKQQAATIKIRDEVAKGPGSGMEAGSADAARFMADQVNKSLAVKAVPDGAKPTDEQLLEEARKQYEQALIDSKKSDEQTELLKKLLEKQPLARAR